MWYQNLIAQNLMIIDQMFQDEKKIKKIKED